MALYKDFLKDGGIAGVGDEQYFYNVDQPASMASEQNGFNFGAYSGHPGTSQPRPGYAAMGVPGQGQAANLFRPQGMAGQDSVHNNYGVPSSAPSRPPMPGSAPYPAQPGASMFGFPQTPNATAALGNPRPGDYPIIMQGGQALGGARPTGSALLRDDDGSDDFPALPGKGDSLALDGSLAPGIFSSLGGAVSAPPASLAPGPLSGASNLSKDGKFGIAGLMEIHRSTEKDSYMLSMGMDLTTFGLNLNSAESLYLSFTSPFADASQSDPQFNIPQCYNLHPPALKTEHLSKFHLETLFYMFYQLPRDILQACAAQELYRRDWRYHAEMRVWLKPRTAVEMQASHPNIQFVYFDAKAWEVRLFNAAQVRGNLKAGLVSEEDIRVKPPLSGLAPIAEPS